MQRSGEMFKVPGFEVRLAVCSAHRAIRAVTPTFAAVFLAVAMVAGWTRPPSAARQIAPSTRPASTPSRIISLVPAATEMLFAIGAGARVVAVSSFDRYPPDVERLPRVGALLDPDVERILSLRPDLVVAYRSQADLLNQLERAQIPVFAYAHGGLSDVTGTIRQIGDRIGEAERARRLSAEIDSRIEAVRAWSRGKTRPRTLAIFSRDGFALRAIFASGGTGFIHDMITAAGGENVFADVPRESLQVTSELLIARRPEVILELRPEPMDADTTARELRVWTALSSVPAVRNRRIHIIADPRTVIPGPRVGAGVELLWQALHGDRRPLPPTR